MIEEYPLITARVLTYNSAKYLIEALDSVKNQTYQNIELVISDDCSTDNSVEIAQQWLSENKSRFVRSEILTVPQNTGVSASCNRTVAWARGEWIGGVAGDDVLLPSAFEDFVVYAQAHPDAKVIVGGTIKIDEESNEIPGGRSHLEAPFYYADDYPVKKQFWLITKCFFACGPSTFVSTDVIRAVGGYDERFPLLEDYPFYIRVTHAGYHMNWLGKYTVKYRVSSSSISHAKECDSSIYSKSAIYNIKVHKHIYRREYLNWFWRVLLDIDLWWKNKIIDAGNTLNNTRCRVSYRTYRLISPFAWVERYMWRSR